MKIKGEKLQSDEFSDYSNDLQSPGIEEESKFQMLIDLTNSAWPIFVSLSLVFSFAMHSIFVYANVDVYVTNTQIIETKDIKQNNSSFIFYISNVFKDSRFVIAGIGSSSTISFPFQGTATVSEHGIANKIYNQYQIPINLQITNTKNSSILYAPIINPIEFISINVSLNKNIILKMNDVPDISITVITQNPFFTHHQNKLRLFYSIFLCLLLFGFLRFHRLGWHSVQKLTVMMIISCCINNFCASFQFNYIFDAIFNFFLIMSLLNVLKSNITYSIVLSASFTFFSLLANIYSLIYKTRYNTFIMAGISIVFGVFVISVIQKMIWIILFGKRFILETVNILVMEICGIASLLIMPYLQKSDLLINNHELSLLSPILQVIVTVYFALLYVSALDGAIVL